MNLVECPESIYRASVSPGVSFAALPRLVPATLMHSTEPDDPARAWFEAATVFNVLETVSNLLRG